MLHVLYHVYLMFIFLLISPQGQKVKLKGHKRKRRETKAQCELYHLSSKSQIFPFLYKTYSLFTIDLYKNQSSLGIEKTGSTSFNDKHSFSEPRPFPQMLHLPSLKRHVRSLTAEKTQHCAQGYRWKLDEYLYLPA